MRIFNLSARAESALTSALQALQPAPAPDPYYTVRAASGSAREAATATGAFRILRQLAPADRETARIYDADGWCLYR